MLYRTESVPLSPHARPADEAMVEVTIRGVSRADLLRRLHGTLTLTLPDDAAVLHELLIDATATASAHDAMALSGREVAVARLLASGYSNKEIAARLAVSVKTVETYKARSMRKLGLRSRVELVRHAVRCGWLTEQPQEA